MTRADPTACQTCAATEEQCQRKRRVLERRPCCGRCEHGPQVREESVS